MQLVSSSFARAGADEIRDDAIDAGRAELPVAVAGDDHVFAVGEGALRDARRIRAA